MKKITTITVYNAVGYERLGSDEVVVGASNEIQDHLATFAQIKRRLGRPDELTLTIRAGSPWSYEEALTYRTRVYTTYDDGSIEAWRVSERRVETSGAADMIVKCLPLWLDVGDSIFRWIRDPDARVDYSVPLTGKTVDATLDLVFDSDYGIEGDRFKKGTIESPIGSDIVALDINGTPHLSIFHDICRQSDCEFDPVYNSGSDLYRFNVKYFVGSQNMASNRPVHGPVGDGSTSSNRRSLTWIDSQRDFYTRLIPFAGDEREPVGIAGAWLPLDLSKGTSGSGWSADPGQWIAHLQHGIIAHDGAYTEVTSKGYYIMELPSWGNPYLFSDIEETFAGDKEIHFLNHATVPDPQFGSDTAVRLHWTGGAAKAFGPGTWVGHVNQGSDEAVLGIVERAAFFTEVAPYENLFETLARGSGDMSAGTGSGATYVPSGMAVVDSLLTADVKRIDQVTPWGIILLTGDHTAYLSSGENVTLEGTVDNDGDYSMLSSPVYNAGSDHTTATVSELLPGTTQSTAQGIFIYFKEATQAESSVGADTNFGTRSWKLTADYGGGCETNALALNFGSDNPYLSIWASVKVDAGTMRMYLRNGSDTVQLPAGATQAESSAKSLLGLSIGGLQHDSFVTGSDWHVVFESREDGTIFVVDALAVTNSPTPWEYREDMGPASLWEVAAEELVKTGGIQPAEYEGEVYDIAYQGGSEITIGSLVEVKDLHANGTAKIDTTARVIELFEEDHPVDGRLIKRLRLARENSTLTDRLKTIRKLSKRPVAPPVELPGSAPFVEISTEAEFGTIGIDNPSLFWNDPVRGGWFVYDEDGIGSQTGSGDTFQSIDGRLWQRNQRTKIYADWFGDCRTADDAAVVIQKAIDAVSTATDYEFLTNYAQDLGAEVVLPAGLLTIKTTIDLRSRVSLTGAGKGITVLQPHADLAGAYVISSGTLTGANRGQYHELRGFSIAPAIGGAITNPYNTYYGPQQADATEDRPNAAGIELRDGGRLRVEDVSVHNIQGIGLSVLGSEDCTFVHVDIMATGVGETSPGLLIKSDNNGTENRPPNALHFFGCRIETCPVSLVMDEHASSGGPPRDIQFIGCKFEDRDGAAVVANDSNVKIYVCAGLTFTACEFASDSGTVNTTDAMFFFDGTGKRNSVRSVKFVGCTYFSPGALQIKKWIYSSRVRTTGIGISSCLVVDAGGPAIEGDIAIHESVFSNCLAPVVDIYDKGAVVSNVFNSITSTSAESDDTLATNYVITADRCEVDGNYIFISAGGTNSRAIKVKFSCYGTNNVVEDSAITLKTGLYASSNENNVRVRFRGSPTDTYVNGGTNLIGAINDVYVPWKALSDLSEDNESKLRYRFSPRATQVYLNAQWRTLQHVHAAAAAPTQYEVADVDIQGFQYFDTVLDTPRWWNGSDWVTPAVLPPGWTIEADGSDLVFKLSTVEKTRIDGS